MFLLLMKTLYLLCSFVVATIFFLTFRCRLCHFAEIVSFLSFRVWIVFCNALQFPKQIAHSATFSLETNASEHRRHLLTIKVSNENKAIFSQFLTSFVQIDCLQEALHSGNGMSFVSKTTFEVKFHSHLHICASKECERKQRLFKLASEC